ncbi:MAG TPA: metallophosphoesterase family protein [Longimicrobiaceae bacterium]|nr:metallophosphoesterase family protein [Longimicrobiaceae bacterium]
MRIGIISDTHGLLRAEVFEHFEGVEHIVHAGDVGPADILDELATIAPVTAVSGNTDDWDIRNIVREVASVDLDGMSGVVVHGHRFGSPTPTKLAAEYPEADFVIFGHSHRPLVQQVGSVLAVNPGSAGPPRFGSVPTLMVATIEGDQMSPRLIHLDPGRK